MNKLPLILASAIFFSNASLALTVKLCRTTDAQESIGTVELTDTPYGVLITPDLKGLTPGVHGFHLHVKPSCADNGKGAGGHFDPEKTKQHLGPYFEGHLGDLPALHVCQDGTATQQFLAPRLMLKNFKGHSLMIHAGADNYSDIPARLGGGGKRVACGVIRGQKKKAAS